jgi:hypothetical protein
VHTLKYACKSELRERLQKTVCRRGKLIRV